MLFAGLSAFAQLSEVRKVGTFDKVSVGSGFDLFITQGDVVKLTVEGSSELVQSVVAVVEKGELKIYSKKGDAVWGREPAPKIFLTLKSIKAIEAGGGAKVYGKNSIKLESLKLTTGGGSDMIMDVNVNELKLNAGGGSTLTVKGKAILLEVKASGGCDLLAKELIADVITSYSIHYTKLYECRTTTSI